MGMLRRLWTWLTSSPRRAQRRWNLTLNPIDIQKLSDELNLKAEAHRLGAAGVPRASDDILSGPESAIVKKIEDTRAEYMAWGELRLSSLNQELARKDITQDINQARKADEEFERLASAELTSKSAILQDLGKVATGRQEELHRFKRENRIDRLPMAPTGTGKTWIIVFAFALAAIEAGLNAKFFAKGLDTGLVGGFIEAGITASCNVGVSFLLGVFGVRYVHHVRIGPRLFGYFMVALTLGIVFAMGLGIAHYRDALVSGAENAGSLTLQTLLSSPFELKEVFSWLLFLISVGFATAAVFDGYKIDDLYPGYGKKYRLSDDAVQEYNDEIDEMREFLEDTKTSMLENAERAASQAEASVAIYKNLIGEKERAGNALANALAGADDALRALLQEFRGENAIARGDKPCPAYFNTSPQLRALRTPNFSTLSDQENLAAQSELLGTLIAEMEGIRARIQTAFNQRFDALRTLDTHFTSKAGMDNSGSADRSSQDVSMTPMHARVELSMETAR